MKVIAIITTAADRSARSRQVSDSKVIAALRLQCLPFFLAPPAFASRLLRRRHRQGLPGSAFGFRAAVTRGYGSRLPATVSVRAACRAFRSCYPGARHAALCQLQQSTVCVYIRSPWYLCCRGRLVIAEYRPSFYQKPPSPSFGCVADVVFQRYGLFSLHDCRKKRDVLSIKHNKHCCPAAGLLFGQNVYYI